jgi:hypothetical protein
VPKRETTNAQNAKSAKLTPNVTQNRVSLQGFMPKTPLAQYLLLSK